MTNLKDQIIQAAIRLFARHGVGVATSKIAKEANVSNGTLFNYFATKQDLIDGTYFHLQEAMANLLKEEIEAEATLRDVLFQSWKKYIDWAVERPTEVRVFYMLRFSQNLSEEVVAKSEALFSNAHQVMAAGIEAGALVEVPVALYPQLTAAQLMAVLFHIGDHALSRDEIEDLTQKSFDIYWDGVSLA